MAVMTDHQASRLMNARIHSMFVCADDCRRLGYCDAPEMCGCSCHQSPPKPPARHTDFVETPEQMTDDPVRQEMVREVAALGFVPTNLRELVAHLEERDHVDRRAAFQDALRLRGKPR